MMRKWVSRIRTIAAWLVLAACVNFFVADHYVDVHHPMMGYFSPRPPHALLMWRNGSLIAMVVLTLVSIPRWQSFVGVASLIVFFTMFGG